MVTYDDEMLQDINKNVDLVDYIGQFIELEKRGNDYFGRCFNHLDLTPSFSISPEKNLYYCHSCKIGGGIISFIMKYEELTFDESVEKASKLANMDLSKMCHSETVKMLRRINNKAKESKIVEKEILDKSILDKYTKGKIDEWIDEGIRQDELNLFDVRIDYQGNRIIYPVYNIDGELINIKGRTRHKDYKKLKLPKYINYFKVGTMDYLQGLNITLLEVLKSKEIILFESIKSVMKCYGWGYTNVASVEKHSLTDEQIKLLIRLKVNVVFAYDSDVSYEDIKEDILKLKRFTNVYVIEDKLKLLGGSIAKNSPADCGKEIFERLYLTKRKII